MLQNNILTEKLPEALLIGGCEYPIKTDFRAWLKFGKLISESFGDGAAFGEQMMNVLSCVIDFSGLDKITCSMRELIAALFEFYSGGKNESSGKEKKGKQRHTAAVYDFYEDADYIFASFFQIYGIDLTETDMHWHKFLALFRSLPEECKFSKILSYRSCDTSKMRGEEKKFYTEMKEYYALPDNRSREEKDAALYAEISMIV